MKQDNCELCKKYGQEGSTLFESDNFYIAPSLGPLVEGHILIISKQHVLGIGHLEKGLVGEFELMRQKVRELLTKLYVSPLFFEHGPAKPQGRSGCCIEHLHLHAVPVDFNVAEDLSNNFTSRQIYHFEELREFIENQRDYLYYETQRSERFAFTINCPIPSQYLRKVISVKLGSPDSWDWKTNPSTHDFNRTLIKISREI